MSLITEDEYIFFPRRLSKATANPVNGRADRKSGPRVHSSNGVGDAVAGPESTVPPTRWWYTVLAECGPAELLSSNIGLHLVSSVREPLLTLVRSAISGSARSSSAIRGREPTLGPILCCMICRRLRRFHGSRLVIRRIEEPPHSSSLAVHFNGCNDHSTRSRRGELKYQP